MEKKCKNCRWWYKENLTSGEVCVNGDSDEVAEFTDAEFSCKHYEARESDNESI